MFPVEYQTLPKTHVRRSQRCREIAGWEGSHEHSPAPGPLSPLGPGHSGEWLIREITLPVTPGKGSTRTFNPPWPFILGIPAHPVFPRSVQQSRQKEGQPATLSLWWQC